MTTDREGRAARALAPPLYSVELAMAICQRVAAGESLMAVCRHPGMPHRTTVRNWGIARPDFAAALAAAQQSRRVAWRARDISREAARRRRPPPAKGGQPSTYTPEMGEEICWRLVHGMSLRGIARDPQMPCPGTVYGWLKRHPEFVEMYVEARRMQADYLFDEAREVALDVRPDTVSADRLRFDIIRWQTSNLAPKKYRERVQVALELKRHELEAAEAAKGGGVQRILVTSFERSPKDPKVVIAYPPRNAEEEAKYLEAYGEPYSGPGPLSSAEDWRYKQAHQERRRKLKIDLGLNPWGS